MAVEYINRRDDTYYLHQGKTKTRKPKYFFSKKRDGLLATVIPDGYEIYENPNAQVFLRRTPAKVFTDEEISTVEDGVRQFAKLEHFKIDIKKNQIVIFLPDQDIESLVGMFLRYQRFSRSRIECELEKVLTYSPMMRFVLADESSRQFDAGKMCFTGPEEDWLFLDSGRNLKKLVKKYCSHLGKESFFELPWGC